uniref:Uncharacterized protein n=1 Tax=Meloidogyne javanica TaxID=6303 RepID=A0A915LV67_MELJA
MRKTIGERLMSIILQQYGILDKDVERRAKHSMPIILGWNNLVDNNNIMDIQTGLYNTDECKYECEYTTNKDL